MSCFFAHDEIKAARRIRVQLTRIGLPKLQKFYKVMLSVLFEDNHLIAINKRAGVLVQGDVTGDVPLSELVKEYIKEKYKKPGVSKSHNYLKYAMLDVLFEDNHLIAINKRAG